MSAVKSLAKQTLWYGASNIAARMLNYLLTPLLVYIMQDSKGVAEFGGYSLLYVWIAVANVIFTYGFETGYFRFSNNPDVDQKKLFDTTFGSLVLSSIVLCILFGLFYKQLNAAIGFETHPEYILYVLAIIGIDTIAAIPFAKLRQEARPQKYAFVKIGGIIVNIALVVLLLAYMPIYLQQEPDSIFKTWYEAQNRIGLLLIANIGMSLFVLLMLFKEWKSFSFKIDKQLWKQIFKYSSPMIITGLAGMINEVIDRQMLQIFLPTTDFEAKALIGVYSANYKLAIFITLFIQAFKMAAEPFFFKQSNDGNAPALYAKVMKWFFITVCVAFLTTTLFIEILQYFLSKPFRFGLSIVPILLMANIFLGVYYNMSIWYKITDKMRMGVYITLIGSIITLVGNYIFIPYYGIYAAAWTTLVCYAVMSIICYLLGQKYYPVPYPIKTMAFYTVVMLGIYGIFEGIRHFITNALNDSAKLLVNNWIGLILLLIFLIIVYKKENIKLNKLSKIRRKA